MPVFETAASVVDLRRKAMLLDTNVLIKAFGDSEDAADVLYFLEELPIQWLVPLAVVVEAWGFLVGKQKLLLNGHTMLAWLNTPGKATVISQRGDSLSTTQRLVLGARVDCVDAMLFAIASEITTQCEFAPALQVATYDTRDFYRSDWIALGVTVGIYDMNADFPRDPFEADS